MYDHPMAKKVIHSVEARLPEWLRQAVREDIEHLGHGPKSKDGVKAMVCAALMLYLELPESDRRDLARLALLPDDEHAKREVDRHWIIRVCRAVTALGEGAVERVEQFAATEAGTEHHSDRRSPGREGSSPARKSRREA